MASAEQLPFADSSFDAVLSGAAFHWFTNERALGEIKRVLKEGALLFIFWNRDIDRAEENSIDSSIFEKYNWEVVPQKLWDEEQIKNLLEKNGFTNTQTQVLPSPQTYTLDEAVGLETTSSAFALLSEGDKNSFVFDVAENLKKKLGDRKIFEINQVTKVVYGFK